MTDHPKHGDDDVTAFDHPTDPERWARWVDVNRTEIEHQASLSTWLLHCPGSHPGFCSWAISVIHLRPIAGGRPARLHYPAAQYELILAPIAGHVEPDQPADTWPTEVAGAITIQFHGPDDRGACHLVRLLARAVMLGQMPLYPPGAGLLWTWWQSMMMTLEHMATGGHGPSDPNVVRQN